MPARPAIEATLTIDPAPRADIAGPVGYPLLSSIKMHAVDYDYIAIADRDFLLPIRSTVRRGCRGSCRG